MAEESDELYFKRLEESLNVEVPDPEPIAFKDWGERGFLAVSKRDTKGDTHCWHSKKFIDDNSRMVQCKQCEAYLDPYDVLRRLVLSFGNLYARKAEYEKEILRLNKEKIDLRDELRRLDAKIKRRIKKLKTSGGG